MWYRQFCRISQPGTRGDRVFIFAAVEMLRSRPPHHSPQSHARIAARIATSSHGRRGKRKGNQIKRWTHLAAGPKHIATLQVGHWSKLWSSRHFIVNRRRLELSPVPLVQSKLSRSPTRRRPAVCDPRHRRAHVSICEGTGMLSGKLSPK